MCRQIGFLEEHLCGCGLWKNGGIGRRMSGISSMTVNGRSRLLRRRCGAGSGLWRDVPVLNHLDITRRLNRSWFGQDTSPESQINESKGR